MVNLIVWDSNGCAQPTTSVELVQPGQPDPTHGGAFCRWMPYQVENAERAAKFGELTKRMGSTGFKESVEALKGAAAKDGLAAEGLRATRAETISTLPTAPEPVSPAGVGSGEMEAPPKPVPTPPVNPWLKPPG
jgi:hypothetical protein